MMKEQVTAAFDAFEPDEETLARMWEGLEARLDAELAGAEMAAAEGVVAAVDAAAGAGAAGAAAGEGAGADANAAGEGTQEGAREGTRESGFAVTPGAKRPARRAWLPAVAAVLVLAVGVGAVIAGVGNRASDMAPKAFEVERAADGGTAEYASTTDFEAYDAFVTTNAAIPGEAAAGASGGASEAGELAAEDAASAAGEADAASVEFCVRPSAEVSAQDFEALCAAHGLSVVRTGDDPATYIVSPDHDVTPAEAAALADALAAEPGILSVE